MRFWLAVLASLRAIATLWDAILTAAGQSKKSRREAWRVEGEVLAKDVSEATTDEQRLALAKRLSDHFSGMP